MQAHKVTLSDYMAARFIEALEHLQADGCRRVHIVSHSMGARVVSGAAERLSRFFPSLPTEFQGINGTVSSSTIEASRSNTGSFL
jgi:pimeloyl-ACP methyl ester carboxylesterase